MKNFKSLSKKTKNLLNLGLIVFLVIVLPLLVWAIINLNFNQREKAATGEPPQTMQINWTTLDITITADEFYINSGSKTYYGDLQNVLIIPSVIDTGPNPIRWASIEIQSTQHGDDLRMKVYFKSNGSTWNVDSVGVLNSNYSSGWITYDNDLIYTVLGHAYYHEGVLDFALNDPNTGQKIADVHTKNLRIHAFTGSTPPPTASFQPTTTATPTQLASPSASPTPQVTNTPSPTSSPTPRVGDVNSDGHVNLIDIGMVIDEYDKTNPSNPRVDINGNGKVDLIDIGLIIDNYEW